MHRREKRIVWTIGNPVQQCALGFADLIKYWEIQRGKGVKLPTEQILTFVFDVLYVKSCALKISIYKVNSQVIKKICINLSYF